MALQASVKVEEFFRSYRVRKYAKGQVLILNGDQPTSIFYLLEGKVKQYDVTYHGDEIILNIFKPPAYFPMMLALNKVENRFIYEAETDISVQQAPINEVIHFIKDNPDVLFDLLKRVYIGMDGLLGRMANLMAGSAKSRLAYELVIEARRFGAKQKNGGYFISIHEKELGARAGLTRETVSREISKFKSAGLITMRSKGVLVNDLAGLEKIQFQEI